MCRLKRLDLVAKPMRAKPYNSFNRFLSMAWEEPVLSFPSMCLPFIMRLPLIMRLPKPDNKHAIISLMNGR